MVLCSSLGLAGGESVIIALWGSSSESSRDGSGDGELQTGYMGLNCARGAPT
jgi:hypothetical protein